MAGRKGTDDYRTRCSVGRHRSQSAQVSQIAKRYEDTLAARGSSIFEDEDDDDNKPYEVTENGTAIIGIKGPMLNADLPEWVAQAFGLDHLPLTATPFRTGCPRRKCQARTA